MRGSLGPSALLPVVSFSPNKQRKRRARKFNIPLLALLLVGTWIGLYGLVRVARPGNSKGKFQSPDERDELQAEQGVSGIAVETQKRLFGDENIGIFPATSAAHTLVLYIFAGTDREYVENLRYFIREGIQEGDGHEYVIVLQEGQDLPYKLDPLPKLPSNARFVYHPNKCFDLGTIGWVLDTGFVDISKYKYVVWLNSSVRGPFMPAYVRRRMHWTDALTSRLTDTVKMVGATINCGGAYTVPAVPHVQSYLVAVDQVGLKLLIDEGNTFHCWDNLAETVIHSELGASAVLLMAGYNIDCLMLRYQGVNWRLPSALDCNAGMNPIQNGFNDGINVDPLEVMFVKVKSSMKGAKWGHVRQAVKYDQWSQNEAGTLMQDLKVNEWITEDKPLLLSEAQRRGAACFDHLFYVNANRVELGWIMREQHPQQVAFQHYLDNGMHEGRPHNFVC